MTDSSRLKSSLLAKPATENKLLKSSVLTSSTALSSSASLLSKTSQSASLTTQSVGLTTQSVGLTTQSVGLTTSVLGKAAANLTSNLLSSSSNLKSLDQKINALEEAVKKPEPAILTKPTQSKLTLLLTSSSSEKPLVQSIGHLSLNSTASVPRALELRSTKSTQLLTNEPVQVVKTSLGVKRQHDDVRSAAVSASSGEMFAHDYTDEFEELVSQSIISKIDKENQSEEDSARAKRIRRNQYLKQQLSQAVSVAADPRAAANSFKRAIALTLASQKSVLINTVSSSLLSQPNFKNKNDPTRSLILECAEAIARVDPQFILKLALYTRRELNIRVTANFLLCLASFKENCRPFLHRYFKHSIMLPSDWIDVAEQYQLFTDKHINFGSLPSALRKCMVEKFPDFDQYQLAKYNKEKSRMAQNNKLKDIKHVKSKIRESDGDTGASKAEQLTESKYIKTLSKGLKLNDKIVFEVVAEATCPLLKFDIVQKQELKKTERTKTRIGGLRGVATAEKTEIDESVAVRFGIDFAYQRITMKSYLHKAWTKKPEVLNDTKSFALTRGQASAFYFIEVKADRFVLGKIDKPNETTVVRMASYLHSKHNIEIGKLNTVRVSGVDIKLKDIEIESKDKLVLVAEPNEADESEKELKQRSFTLKQLIRQLHISKPVENVMALIGKKYPLTFEDFVQSKLPGLFDSDKAGKRMKLPIPETWETQISIKGNKAHVWESLIDNKKLPYMAMLRNLRNMITVGVSEKHHQWVIKKLQDEGAVVHSKQFPFRFFSAYEVLEELEEELKKYQEWTQSAQGAVAGASYKPARDNRKKQSKRQKQTEKFTDIKYDETLVKRYKTALDNALKVATTFNINPIKGSTAIVLFSDFQSTRVAPNRSLGRKPRHASELAALLALMFKYSCEFAKLNVFRQGTSYKDIELEQGTILDNMSSLLKLTSGGSSSVREATAYPRKLFGEMLLEKEHYDNIVVIGEKIDDTEFQREFLRKYRANVNENLLFVFVNVGASECSLVSSVEFDHTNDVCIAGFSDAILRFVAERGNQGQLVHIENIDKSYELPDLRKNALHLSRQASKTTSQGGEEAMDWETQAPSFGSDQAVPERNVLPLMIPVSQWKTLKVFISSTFRDMHSERDVLSKIVFPMLRAKLNPFLINVYEIDMRWGITESQANENKTLEICLSQILSADYFVGMIGERYGQTMSEYKFAKQDKRLGWLNSYLPGASITELETECQIRKFREPEDKAGRYERSFFYFRDNSSFIDEVPAQHRDQFESEGPLARAKVQALKQRIKREPFEIYDGYRAKWYRADEVKAEPSAKRALLTDLDAFAERVFKNLFNAILSHEKLDSTSTVHTLEQLAQADEMAHLTNLNRAYVHVCSQSFVGRQKLLTGFTKLIKENQLVPILGSTTESARELISKQNAVANIVLVSGEAGCGKTAFMCHYFGDYHFQIEPSEELNLSNRFMHCVGAFKGSESILLFLKRFCITVNRRYELSNAEAEMRASNDLGYFKGMFAKILQQLNDLIVTEKFYVIVDSVDQFLDSNGAVDLSFSWLPVDNMPSRVFFILSARCTSQVRSVLGKVLTSNRDMQNPIKLSVYEIDSLDVLDKSELVRLQLGRYNKYLDETPFNNQMKLLTGKRDSMSPLYLALACEELRTHNQFETLSAKIKEMPIKINLLLDYVLERLESDFGKSYVRAAFLFICSSKEGLIEFELKRLIEIYFQAEKLCSLADLVHLNAATADDTGMLVNLMKNSAKNVSDQATTAKFLSFLDSISKTFLNPRSSEESSSIISIRPHELIATALRNRYGAAKTTTSSKNAGASVPAFFGEQQAHKLMALFYWDAIDSDFERSWSKASNERAYLSLPFHLALSDSFVDLLNVVCDLNFIYKKCQLGLAYSLMSDFDLHEQSRGQSILHDQSKRSASSLNFFFHSASRNTTAAAAKSEEAQHPILATDKFQDYKKFVSTNYHLLQSNPKITYQQAMNEPNHSWPAQDLRNILKSSSKSNICGSFFEWANKPQDKAVTSLLPTTIADFSTSVCSVAISPDGQKVACGTENCDVRYYQLATATLLRTFQGHSGRINHLCFVNSDILCSASFDGVASLWNVNDGYRIKTLNKHNGHSVSGCAAEPNGKSVVTCGWDCTAKIWNPTNGNLEGELRGHDRPISCVVFNPEGNLVATGCWDSCVRIFNLYDRARKAVLRGHKSSVRTLAYSHTGTYLASASIDGEVKLWNAKNGTTIATLNGHSMPVNFVKFSPNNQFLVTGSSDRCAKIWTGHIGKMAAIIRDETAEKASSSPVTAVTFNQATGSIIAAGHHSGEIKFYETHGGQLKSKLKVHSSPVKRVKFTNYGGKCLVSTAEDGTIKLVKVENMNEPCVVAELTGPNKPVSALALSRFNTIVVGSDDCLLRVYSNALGQIEDTSDSEMMDIFEMNTKIPPKKQTSRADSGPRKIKCDVTLSQHQAPITACSFDSEGQQFASCSKDATIIIWKSGLTDWQERLRINSAHLDWITDLQWSNSSDFILTASNDLTLKIWSACDGKERSVLTGHTSNISSCAFQYGCVVSTSCDGCVKIWSHKGHEISTLLGHQGKVNACDLWIKVQSKQSGKKDQEAASAEADDHGMTLGSLWADRVEEEEWQAEHKRAKLNKQDFTIEQVYLVTASDDSSVRLWKPVDSDYLVSLEKHNDKINALDLSKDGTLATASADKSVNAWNLRPFFDQVLSGSLVSKDRVIQNHNSEITSMCVSKSKGVILSSSRDGLVIAWQYTFSQAVSRSGLRTREIDGFRFLAELQAHYQTCSQVCLVDDSKPGYLVFATGSTDKSVKTWRLALTPDAQSSSAVAYSSGAISSIETLVLGSQVVFLQALAHKSLHNNFLLAVDCDSARMRINSIKLTDKHAKSSITCSVISQFTGIFEKIKLVNDDRLYVTLLHDKILRIDVAGLLTKAESFIYQPNQAAKVVNTMKVRLFDSSDFAEILKRNSWNGLWYTAVEEQDDNTIIAGDHRGTLHVSQPIPVVVSSNDTRASQAVKLVKLDQVHDERITELLTFKTKSSETRIVSASQDGSVKVWSQLAENKLGQFNLRSGISCMIKLDSPNQQSADHSLDKFCFLIGDQMGNLNLIKWYEDLDDDE